MAGGCTQQSAIGGLSSASSSMLVRSFGRSSTQTLSSLSTASPVTPPSFHLFGSGFGQSGSNLYFGAAWPCPCTGARTPARRATHTTNKLGPAHRASARRLRSVLMDGPPLHSLGYCRFLLLEQFREVERDDLVRLRTGDHDLF